MTIKTFWTIFLKILGLWLLTEALPVLNQLVLSLSRRYYTQDTEFIYEAVLIALVVIVIYGFILWLFLLKTAWLIHVLKLDKGFTEEKIELTVSHATVLSIATIVIGGLMFIDSFPQLCRDAFSLFQARTIFRESPDSMWVIFHLVQTVIAYLLMTNSHVVVKLLNRKKQSPENE
jgi:hypothetical protein